MFNMLKTSLKLVQQPKMLSRTFITHIPRVSSMGGTVTSSLEHAPVDTYAGDITFNEDIAIERIHEKAIAADSMHAAANFGDHRVVTASANAESVNILGH